MCISSPAVGAPAPEVRPASYSYCCYYYYYHYYYYYYYYYSVLP